MMISAHKGTSAQLSLAGRRLNLLPAAFMQPAQKRMFDELLRSGNFDSVYKRQQVAGHRAALQVHGAFAARGSSPTLRPIAQAAVPIVRRHLAMALKL